MTVPVSSTLPPPVAPVPSAPAPTPPRRGGGGEFAGWLVAAVGTLVALVLAGWLVTVAGTPKAAIADWVVPLDTALQPPLDTATSGEWSSWASKVVAADLSAQADALVAGDQAGFLAPVDPANADLLADHLQRYKNLRALGVGVWKEKISSSISPAGSRSWDVPIEIDYCFGDADCKIAVVINDSTWAFQNGHLVETALEPTPQSENGPRPWEVTDLVVQTGQRVVVAAPQLQAWRLPEAVSVADAAAAIDDTLAVFTPRPSRYVIFLAGSDEWAQWYTGSQPEWAAGLQISGSSAEVMVNAKVEPQSDLPRLLTHEMAHVATLAGLTNGFETYDNWWLVEGIAEYATVLGKPVTDYDGFATTRAFVNSGWDGKLPIDPPTADDSLEGATDRYGIAFLSVRAIAEKHGQDSMLDFFGAAVRDRESLDSAATSALGMSWADVSAECVSFIYSAS